ncbi:T9SS type A sorting domain-containing protein [candidate division WOR-3 bacterium]|nr:T9SS type A sorting domain-containing protein [candidate division WOR-3 bacterium]
MRNVLVIIPLSMIPLMAQPVFTADDVPEIGLKLTYTYDQSPLLAVNIGTTGGPQTWDFSREVSGAVDSMDIIEPSGTPAEDSFPDADRAYYRQGYFVYKVSEIEYDTINYETYAYYKTTSTAVLYLGQYINYHSTEFPDECEDTDPDLISSAVPLQMDAQWQNSTSSVDTVEQEEFIYTLDQTGNSHTKVDAWGEMLLAQDTFEVLRAITYDTTVLHVTGLNFPLDTTTTFTYITYTWRAAGLGQVALIRSEEGETNPDFALATSYVVLTEHSGGGTEVEDIASRSVVPDLGVRGGKVRFNLTMTGQVKLEVFDVGGRKTCGLFHGVLPEGEQVFDLPRDLNSGVYFIRLEHPSGTSAGKFVIVN